MSFRLGLTGSIGMGKTTTAQMFADAGCAVWDADAAVHRLYAKGGAAVAPMSRAFPAAIVDDAVSREVLKQIISDTPGALKTIEGIVHPLVALDRFDFVAQEAADIIVFDNPILFETGMAQTMDAVVVVSVTPEIQRARVLARATMSPSQFALILAKQMPDAEKRALADYVIVTDTVEHAAAQVQDVLKDVRNRIAHA
jgi:dephospho-CoA kinase